VQECNAGRYRYPHETMKTSRPPYGAGQVCEGVDPMGRGRAKAKQTKVARDLKYQTHETDFGALANELHGQPGSPSGASTEPDADEYDGWADRSPSASRD
jgi:hypothetical protein